jgi:hypothetical protein
MSQDRFHLWVAVNMVMNLEVPYRMGNFLTNGMTYQFIKKDSASWSYFLRRGRYGKIMQESFR